VCEAKDKKILNRIEVLDSGLGNAMTIMDLSENNCRRLRTSNSIERLNQKIRRRERVIRIFTDRKSVIRLLGALLIEQQEKWSSGSKYLDMLEHNSSINEAKSKMSEAS
jgi:transposase-like protein